MLRWIPDCVVKLLMLSLLWPALVVPTVFREIKLYDFSCSTGMSFCVKDITALGSFTADIKNRIQLSKLCEDHMNKSADERENTMSGMLYPDYTDLTNITRNINDFSVDETNVSKCEAEETNTSCPSVKLCCRYASHQVSSEIYSTCPKTITKTLKCTAITYQHSLRNRDRVIKSISEQPDVYHWTESYVAKTISDNATDADSQVHEKRSAKEEECIENCLNSNWGYENDTVLLFKMKNEVLYIAYNSTEADGGCNCSSGGNISNCTSLRNTPHSLSQYKTVYTVRYRSSKPNDSDSTNICIAVIQSNETLRFEVQNCSYHFKVLCEGVDNVSYPEKEECIDDKDKHEMPTTPSDQKNDDLTTTEKQGAVNVHGSKPLFIALIAVVVLAVLSIVVLLFVVLLKRRKKNRERGRPNSISNRTYQIQNNSSEFEDNYAYISEALQDTERPLLPPRNNVRQIGPQEVVLHNDYSTPSDSIAVETDVYTDTYDNPLRKSLQNSTDKTAKCAEAKQEAVALKSLDKTGERCNECSTSDLKDYEETNMMASNMHHLSSTVETTSESVETKENAARRGSEYEIDDNPHDNDESKELSNPYFLLCKTNDSINEVRADDSCHSDTNETIENSKLYDADSCDYEDTSTIDGKFGQNLNNKSGTHGQELEHNNASEKSLLCTISPVLLKQLNIKIVPDDNEYAIHYKNWPRSSSDEKELNAENDFNDIPHCMSNNAREPEAILQDNKNMENGEYDKLSYVRRVVSTGKERNMYYHVVLKQQETVAKSRTRRASV